MKLLGIGSSLEVSGHVGVVTAIRGVRGKDKTVSAAVTVYIGDIGKSVEISGDEIEKELDKQG